MTSHLPNPDFAALDLGRDGVEYEIDRVAENLAATLSLVRQARHSLDITTRDLDRRLYGDAAVVRAIRHLVLSTRRARVRILVRDPGPAMQASHRLLELAHRLSSYFDLRVPAEQHLDYNQASLVVDGAGVIHRQLADRYEATVCFASRPLGSQLLRPFEEMWGAARQDPRLRRLQL